MSDGEDDYLSDKFLASLESSKSNTSTSKTYSQLRQESVRKSQVKNLAARKKSRKEIEEESRREGLSTSLFDRERARNGDQGDGSTQGGGPSKAMKMMLKMGFKEGEALGKKQPVGTNLVDAEGSTEIGLSLAKRDADSGHLVEPLPVTLWAGRKGLGMGKRLLPTDEPESNRPSKLLKLDEGIPSAPAYSPTDYRNRAKEEYEERRDSGRLSSARKTLVQLNEDNDVKFDILCIDPQRPRETIPSSLLGKIEDVIDARLLSGPISDDAGRRIMAGSESDNRSQAERLKAQMKADALSPFSEEIDDVPQRLKQDGNKPGEDKQDPDFDEDVVQDARDWMLLTNKQRLHFTLDHLRKTYHYCFWCGAKYASTDEMEQSCPGDDEAAHD